eukprot:5421610-Pyramimonas_sp.AAC.1
MCSALFLESPPYTEDHKRHSEEVSRLLLQRRGLRGAFAGLAGQRLQEAQGVPPQCALDLGANELRLTLAIRRSSKRLTHRQTIY